MAARVTRDELIEFHRRCHRRGRRGRCLRGKESQEGRDEKKCKASSRHYFIGNIRLSQLKPRATAPAESTSSAAERLSKLVEVYRFREIEIETAGQTGLALFARRAASQRDHLYRVFLLRFARQLQTVTIRQI